MCTYMCMCVYVHWVSAHIHAQGHIIFMYAYTYVVHSIPINDLRLVWLRRPAPLSSKLLNLEGGARKHASWRGLSEADLHGESYSRPPSLKTGNLQNLVRKEFAQITRATPPFGGFCSILLETSAWISSGKSLTPSPKPTIVKSDCVLKSVSEYYHI